VRGGGNTIPPPTKKCECPESDLTQVLALHTLAKKSPINWGTANTRTCPINAVT
jgi:hypothetical protein